MKDPQFVNDLEIADRDPEGVRIASQKAMRDVFSKSLDGKKTLAWILNETGYFREATTAGEVALKNFSTAFVEQGIGIDSQKKRYDLVEAMLRIADQ